MVCEGGKDTFRFYVDWLLLADAEVVQKGARKMFFDAGGSIFRDGLQFFLAEYEAKGIHFDEIFVWEANLQGRDTYWHDTPPQEREALDPKLTLYDGIAVTAEPGGENNPVARMSELCRDEDFCVFKLDIDRPSLERELVRQLLDASHALGRPVVTEFFFEHHVRGPMERWGWRGTFMMSRELPEETFTDSYEMFTALRRAGIRAHSWV